MLACVIGVRHLASHPTLFPGGSDDPIALNAIVSYEGLQWGAVCTNNNTITTHVFPIQLIRLMNLHWVRWIPHCWMPFLSHQMCSDCDSVAAEFFKVTDIEWSSDPLPHEGYQPCTLSLELYWVGSDDPITLNVVYSVPGHHDACGGAGGRHSLLETRDSSSAGLRFSSYGQNHCCVWCIN